MARAFGPFRVFDFGHQFGLYPEYFSQGFDFSIEGILFGLAFFQHLPDFGERLLIEAAAGLSYMNQPVLLVIEAEYDRAEVRAAAFWLGVAADHGFQPVPDLDLQPLARAA